MTAVLCFWQRLAPPEQKTKGTNTVQNNVSNPKPETVEAVRAHVALRVDLLASCARAANQLSGAASRWAFMELRAIAAGLTDVESVQLAVCEKFPKLTGNGKPSKTPNSSFKTSWDKFVLVAAVLAGEHDTYKADNLVAIAREFVADGNGKFDENGKLVSVSQSLNDTVDRIKADHASAKRDERAAETDEQKASRKAAEDEQLIQQFAGTVANSPAMLTALAGRIAAYTAEDAPKAEACSKLADAIATFTATLVAAETPDAIAA